MDTLPLKHTKWSDRLAFDVALMLEGSGESLDEVIEGNVNKLKKRYPGGDFDVHYSENRKEGDR